MGMWMLPRKMHFGMSGRLTSIVKHKIFGGLVKEWAVQKPVDRS